VVQFGREQVVHSQPRLDTRSRAAGAAVPWVRTSVVAAVAAEAMKAASEAMEMNW
jgi:hypothetical protein